MDPILILGLANIVAKLVMQYIEANPNATQEEVNAHIAANLPRLLATIQIIQAEIAQYANK
jgi:t-SNARE complex subunit (syntaxin)